MSFHTIGGSSTGLAAEFALRQLSGAGDAHARLSSSSRGQNKTIHIVGAGPAGLAAAHAVVQAGGEVILIDDNHLPGGQVWRGGEEQWRDNRVVKMWRALDSHPGFTHVRNAQVIGGLGAKSLLVEIDNSSVQVDFEKLILCTGAREVFLPFPGWTLPGVTGAGGLQALIKGGMSVAGKNVVIGGSGPLLLATASTVVDAGANVVAIVEQKKASELLHFGLALAVRHNSKFRQAISLFSKLKGIPYIKGGQIVEARGQRKVESVLIRTARGSNEFSCDFLAAGFGLTPHTELAAALGCDLTKRAVLVDDGQKTTNEHVWAAGECTGIGGVDKALIEGRLAALDVLGLAPSRADLARRRSSGAFAEQLRKSFELDVRLREMCGPTTVVCRCEDVMACDLAEFKSWRSAKLATRTGMGPCQGRICGPACEFLFGWQAEQSKFPIVPVSAGALSQVGKDDQ